ncbi:MAG: response regulator [archaeon]
MSKKVMVVDDEPDTTLLVDAILKMNKIGVSTYNDAELALNELKKNEKYDLILLDIRMPKISGPEFCELVRKNPKTKNIKIVFFTASSNVDKTKMEKMGVLGVINKPFNNDELVKVVLKYITMK